jgi:succinyl-CoA synthetase beta subunit
MLLPEHWGKELLRRAGIPVPNGRVVASPEAAAAAAQELGGQTVVKVQVTAGKRGKGGGVQFARDPQEARSIARSLLGTEFAGLPVERLLVEERASIAREFYVALMNDARSKSPLILLCADGGMDIEEINARHPEKIARETVDVRTGPSDAQLSGLIDRAGLSGERAEELRTFIRALYDLFMARDLELLEINPLVLGTDGELRALDCKVAIDDSSRRRHAELVEEIECSIGPKGTERELRGRELGLLYIELDGDVALLANGAGLTMATMDAVWHHGGRPANFLEIGGEAYTKATPALELVLSNPRVRSLVVNFCGAFARTDVMTEGVVRAIQTLRPSLPISFCVHGTGEEEAQRMIRQELQYEPYDTMDEAIAAAVDAARDVAAGRPA